MYVNLKLSLAESAIMWNVDHVDFDPSPNVLSHNSRNYADFCFQVVLVVTVVVVAVVLLLLLCPGVKEESDGDSEEVDGSHGQG